MFANPLALLALSLLTLPVLIHMLVRVKGRRVLFPTVKYLRATESHRLRLAKIDRWPLLVVRLLACGLLIFAISDPALIGETRKARAVLLLIDSSLSMNTESAKEQSRSRARELVASLGADDVAAVAQFDLAVNLLCDFTSDRDSLEKSIARYSPNYGTTDFSRALMWANDKLARLSYLKELVLVSDLQAVNVFSSEPTHMSGVDLKIIRIEGGHRINARPGTIALRAAGDNLEVESTALLGEGDRTTITRASFKPVRRDGELSAIASDSNAILTANVAEGDLLAGAITTNKSDEFDADDSRFFVARLPGEKKILLVESRRAAPGQAAFIDKAIRASSQSKMNINQAEMSGSIPESADALARYSVVISPVDALTPGNVAAAREYVRRGGSLILTIGVEADARSAVERVDELRAASSPPLFNKFSEAESPGLMPPLMLADNPDDAQAFASARFLAAHSIQANDSEALLQYSDNQPAAVRVREGAGQVLILGFGLSDKDSSLARSPIFPVFIEWLISCASTNGPVRQFTIGHAPAAGLLRGLTRLTKIYSASGEAQEELALDENAFLRPGVYQADYQSEKIIFALNSPAAESALDQTTDSELLKRIKIDEATVEAVREEKGIALWRALAIGALVMSLLELAFKRVTSDK